MITKINRGLCIFFVWSMHLNFLSRYFLSFFHPLLILQPSRPPLGRRRSSSKDPIYTCINHPSKHEASNLGTCSRVLLIESFPLLFCHVTTLSHAVLRVRLKELGPCDVAVRLPAALFLPIYFIHAYSRGGAGINHYCNSTTA